ncbi:MAG: hypothetical protein M5U09_09730 [Gammaproteobacteria bacterium]|nr:hypothetical protein [Gammaproteobacteria bacterium]
MASKKPTGLALMLVYGGVVLLMPPLLWIFNKDVLVLGVPLPVLYVFGVWLVLIAVPSCLPARRRETRP